MKTGKSFCITLRMISQLALAQQAVLSTPRLRLEQLGLVHFDGVWRSLSDQESNRLTGTHARFTEDAVKTHLAGLPGRDDRADWAVIRQIDGVFLGEVVLNQRDPDNESMNFRIGLSGDGALGNGYGTEATRAAIQYAFDAVGLHRLSLGVYAFNPRALRVYEKCGFIREGVEREALLWDGQRVDQITMSILATDTRGSTRV